MLLLTTWGFRGNAVEGSTNQMATKQIIVQRFSVTSSKSFQDIASRLEAAIGHPDMSVFRRDVTSAKTYSEVEEIVKKRSGLPALWSSRVLTWVTSCERNVDRERQEVCGLSSATH